MNFAKKSTASECSLEDKNFRGLNKNQVHSWTIERSHVAEALVLKFRVQSKWS